MEMPNPLQVAISYTDFFLVTRFYTSGFVWPYLDSPRQMTLYWKLKGTSLMVGKPVVDRIFDGISSLWVMNLF